MQSRKHGVHFENSRRLVVHSEVIVPVIDVAEIGRVKGPLNYLTCYAAGGGPLSNCPPTTLEADLFRMLDG